MTDQKVLRQHTGSSEGWGALWPVSAPAFAGRAGSGIDWLCPSCNAVLVQGAVHEDQFLDLLFRCYSCNEIAASPNRAPGRPLAGRPVLIPPGTYMLGSSVDIIDKPVMTVGQQAADAYAAETGRGQDRGLDGLTPEALRDAASYAAGLLGSSYSDLVEADRRGRASPTPPPRRHRLVKLIEYANHAADLMQAGGPTFQVVLDGDLISEIATFVSLFRRWSKHPEWPKLATTLRHPTEAQHSLMLLAVASYLADAGNGIGIVGDTSGGRIADLWTEPTILERLEVEVKTPQGLRGPLADPLTIGDAERLVERQVKDAASTKSGQLSLDYSGVLAIGGYHLGTGGLDVLEAAAGKVLARQAERKRHLAALVVCELSYQTTTVLGGTGDPSTSSFAPVLDHRLIQHTGYGGGLEIHQGDPPWQTFTPPSPQQASDSKHSPAQSTPSSRLDAKSRHRKRKAQRESRRRSRGR